jgi:hypothetical protein
MAVNVVKLWVTIRMECSVYVKFQGFPCQVPSDLFRLLSVGDHEHLRDYEHLCTSDIRIENRAMSILVGLFFCWLDHFFLEWQATKAENELLSSVLRETNIYDTCSPTKKVKKKKDKKMTSESTGKVQNQAQNARVVQSDSANVREAQGAAVEVHTTMESLTNDDADRNDVEAEENDTVGHLQENMESSEHEEGWSNVESERRKSSALRKVGMQYEKNDGENPSKYDSSKDSSIGKREVFHQTKRNGHSNMFSELNTSTMDSIINGTKSDMDKTVYEVKETGCSILCLPGPSASIQCLNQTKFETNDVEALVRVGVIDKGGHLSAQEYLVGRTVSLLVLDNPIRT